MFELNEHQTSQLISAEHAQILDELKKNTDFFSKYLNCDVDIALKDESKIRGRVKAVGTYFIEITGVGGAFDATLKGKSKIEYANMQSISFIPS